MPSDLKLSVQSVTPDVTLTLSDHYIGSAYSPTVDVSEIEGGHEVTITHKAPSGIITDTFDVLDGVDGTDGIDGVSPTVEIESTTYAHTITITDVDGAHSYTVDTYADEEEARATAESSRVAAESSRVTAEQARATAESSRAAAESARVTAEASRATAEQSRAAAETARESAESTRATVETARTTAESARAIAEQGRATTEQSRATAETARASAESGRVSAETARVSAENARASAESARVTAESARASAETSRTTAESARATAESTRATEWASIETEAQDAISAAETATSDAQDAADDATAAAAEARAASAATWLAGNVLFGELAEGALLTTDDAFAAPPREVDVYGVSTQAGTPTPDAPVEIASVDDLTLMIRGKNLLGLTDVPETTRNGVTYSVSNSVISISGTPTAGFDLLLLPMDVKERYHFTAGEKISFSFDNAPTNVSVVIVHQSSGGICAVPTNNVTINPVWLYVGAIRLRFTSGSAVNASFSIQMEQGTAATTFEPYVGQSVEIPLSNHVGRSLPDGTRDTLTLSYIGPSTREGWGVFGAELVQYVGGFLATSPNGWVKSSSAINGYYKSVAQITDGLGKSFVGNGIMSSWFKAANNLNEYFQTINSCWVDSAVNFNIDPDVFSGTALEFGAWVEEHNIEFYMPLDTPVTHDLGTVELPVLPNPLTAWADGGSAQPTIQLEYERSLSIVIPRIEAQLADMATS